MSETKKRTVDDVVDAIIDELFSNAFGNKAERLVLDVPGLALGNGGGRNRDSVREVIIRHLKG